MVFSVKLLFAVDGVDHEGVAILADAANAFYACLTDALDIKLASAGDRNGQDLFSVDAMLL